MLYWLADWLTAWLTEWLADWLYGTEIVVPKIVKIFSCFMAPECSLPSPKEAAIFSYPELDEFIPCRKILLFKMRYSIILPLRWSMLPKWLIFFSGFRTKTEYILTIFLFPVDTHAKAWNCSHSLAVITGSNPAWCVDVCLLWGLCVVRQSYLRRTGQTSRGILPSVVCFNMMLSRNLNNEGA
jgi:hypothetical protein